MRNTDKEFIRLGIFTYAREQISKMRHACHEGSDPHEVLMYVADVQEAMQRIIDGYMPVEVMAKLAARGKAEEID
jgi:hypothetical protein